MHETAIAESEQLFQSEPLEALTWFDRGTSPCVGYTSQFEEEKLAASGAPGLPPLVEAGPPTHKYLWNALVVEGSRASDCNHSILVLSDCSEFLGYSGHNGRPV
jgi:hypothetical protein